LQGAGEQRGAIRSLQAPEVGFIARLRLFAVQRKVPITGGCL